MSNQLLQFFDSISTEASLQAFVDESRAEDVYLEFKQKSDRRNGDMGDAEKRGFSKALSGFANADGGVLIFGVETARGLDGIDRAAALKPIEGHARFRAKLMDSILNATHPVVDGVRIECIGSGPSSGYVKCYVPPSYQPPHRAVLADHLYWRRVSTGHRRMEHYELEYMFGRRERPLLKIFAEVAKKDADGSLLDMHFFMLNEGRALAKHVGFLCRLPEDCRIESCSGHGMVTLSELNQGSPVVSFNDANCVIHPNRIFFSLGRVVVRRPQSISPIGASICWYAEHFASRNYDGVIPVDGSRYLLNVT